MFSQLKSLALIFLYILIVSVGIYCSCHAFTQPFPTKYESNHLLTTATTAETLDSPNHFPHQLTESQPFHQIATQFVQFFAIRHGSTYSIRSYRLFPITLAVLCFCLIPALGLKRRGGLFETADAPFWVALFIFVSPAFIDLGCSFVPFSFHTFLFLTLLVAARSYVQWPGYCSALALGILIACALIADATFFWVILLLFPAICLGVGWRRLLLYWHTGHIFTMLGLAMGLTLLAHLLGIAAPFVPPMFSAYNVHSAELALRRMLWFGLGGFGVLAWLVVAIRTFYRPNKRWEKVIVFLFPTAFFASFAFPPGSILMTLWVTLSAILIAFLLSELRWLWLRILIGCVTILVLGFGMMQLAQNRHTLRPTLDEQVKTLQTLTDAIRKSGKKSPTIAILAEELSCEATLLWLLRATDIIPFEKTHSADFYLIDDNLQKTALKNIPNLTANTSKHIPSVHFVLHPNHTFTLYFPDKSQPERDL